MKKISKEISKYMSKLGKSSQKKHPKSKDYFSNMAKKRWVKKKTVDKLVV